MGFLVMAISMNENNSCTHETCLIIEGYEILDY